MRKIIEKIKNYFQYRATIKDKYWLSKFRWFGIPIDEASWSNEFNAPVLLLPEIPLLSRDYTFLLDGYEYLKNLIRYTNLKVTIDEKYNLIFNQDEFKFMVDSKQEILILKEIFVDSVYNYSFQNPSIVVDIGFNVGMASLFFSKFEKVEHVYAFEPIEQTLKKGLVNIKLNPTYQNKITLFSYGLGAKNTTLRVNYDYEKKGNTIVNDNQDLCETETVVEAVIKDASKELHSILVNLKDENVVVKMDCEGGEYDIISKWATDHLLEKINILLIEYHNNSPKEILTHLDSAQFDYMILNEKKEIGFIYAWKTGN